MRTFFTENSFYEKNLKSLNKIHNKKKIGIFSCDIARSILPVWFDNFPDDLTIFDFLQSAEDYIFDLTDLNHLLIAKDNFHEFYYTVSHNIDYISNISYAYYTVYNIAYRYVNYAVNVAVYSANASNNKENQWNFIYQLYLQCFKPKHINIPKLPLFVNLAKEIKHTKNFDLYKILIDAVFDHCNIKIKAPCLGLSNWLLFDLLIK